MRKQGPPQAPAFKWGRINVVFIRNPNGDFSTFAGTRDSCSGNLDSEWKGIPPGRAPNPPSPTEEPKPPAPSQGPKTSPDPTPPATTADPLPPSTIIYTAGSNILGAASAAAAIGNPLKGLCTSPNWASKPAPGVPATLDYYYIRFDALMKGPNTFDWGLLEQQIARAKSNQRHVVWSVYTHYPGRELALPGFLSGKVPIIGGQPLYDDPDLIAAMETFIAKWAEEYDGHKSVAFIQLGLLGKWGEWHTYPEKGLLSDRTKDIIAAAFTRGFKTTKLLQRYPRESTNDGPIGYIDHSFTYNTLDGAANGGDEVSWHFWPRLLKNGQGDFWRTRVMGGETRPENQKEVFTPGYRRRTKNKQDFMECVRTTHTTYMVHGNAFSGSGYTGQTLANARQAHAEMGYNFQVTKVAVMANARVDVTVKQVGVAPFYYPLNLELSCNGFTQQVNGVEKIIVENDEKTFSFSGLLRSATCRNQVSIKLRSPFVQPGKAIKFAQMNGTVTLKVPV